MKNNPLKELTKFLDQSKKDIEEAKEKDQVFRDDVLNRIRDIESFLAEKFGYVSFEELQNSFSQGQDNV